MEYLKHIDNGQYSSCKHATVTFLGTPPFMVDVTLDNIKQKGMPP